MKKSFTLLEVIFVIVVIGILSSMIIPKLGSDKLSEASHQVISHIRYTQHLAMNNDKYNASDSNWYKKRWQFIFGKSLNNSGKDTNDKQAYTIFSDTSNTSTGKPDFLNIDNTEIAIDPSNTNKVLSGGYSGTLDWEDKHANKSLNLGLTYGITNMQLSGGCSNKRIVFDHMGRPMDGDSSSLTSPYNSARLVTHNDPCILTLSSPQGSVSIKIEAETGYSCVLDAGGNCIAI
jgi:type II secretory pathway pseudopilin PulG